MTDLDVAPRHHRQSLKQEAANYIRDLIFSGKLHAGERIDQDGIAAALEVSRLPIREALITLEAEGMVATLARRGAIVAPLSREDILDHFRMYGLLNGMAGQRIAEREASDLVQHLADISDRLRATSDPSEQDRLNYEFHRAINVAGGSRRLISVLRILSNSMPSNFFAANTEWDFREQTFDEHDQIVESIRNSDGPGAAAALAEHFTHIGEQAVRTLESVGFWQPPIGAGD